MSDLISFFGQLAYFNYIIIFAAIFLAYRGVSIYYWLLLALIFILQFNSPATFIICYAAIPFIIAFRFLRRNLITKQIVRLIKKMDLLPKISDTEKTALLSGNIWVDGQLFSGRPNFKWIFSQKYPKLNKEEQDFLDNEAEEICRLCNDHQTYENNDLSPQVWQYLRDKKFFGIIIPKKYNGLGFSAFAHSSIIQKLASRSVPLAITAMVPNSLGPAELLLHYGTKEQQGHYLPRLADGREIPCFALTEPQAGSDATSIISNGIIFKDENNEIKIRLNWNKRYITLGAVATLIGLAFQLRDPENLLGKGEDIGITCALIPNHLVGVRQGRRHDPLATPFINSPLNGENVIIGLDSIIGGAKYVGEGWRMLMECLAAGRGISLPSTSAGGAKLVARTVSAYSVIREQFGLSIAKFEGVETVLARIFAKTYLLEAMRSFTAGAVDAGLKPAVITAIAKYHATENFRQIINDGMDIAGGSGIIRGPRNLLANAYFSVPISITVEGANIMTRSLIHFGQGLMLCHPFIYKEIKALERHDLKAFDKKFFAHFGHLINNKVRAILLLITHGHLFRPHIGGIIGKYEQKIATASALFAFLADIALMIYGGNLKKKEKINGRFGDILSAMYMMICVLKKFDVEKRKKEDEIMIKYLMEGELSKIQNAFEELMNNLFTNKLSKILFSPLTLLLRLNRFSKPINDKLENLLVKRVLNDGEFRDNLTSGIYIPKDKNEALGRLENAFLLFEKSTPISSKIKQAQKDQILPKNQSLEKLFSLAIEKNLINKQELELLEQTQAAIYDAIQVDVFSS